MAIIILIVLQFFDTDGETEFIELISDKYYILMVILYWLLFILVINYLLGILDTNLLKILKSKNIIESGILGMALIFALSWLYHNYIRPSHD
ncbi:MAG: hypothetical protein GY790_23235 [Bacteroidetes bacterium]|nr:hypothetical protein [Bacteroidota bacterium]